jgi:hypothetical protein
MDDIDKLKMAILVHYSFIYKTSFLSKNHIKTPPYLDIRRCVFKFMSNNFDCYPFTSFFLILVEK